MNKLIIKNLILSVVCLMLMSSVASAGISFIDNGPKEPVYRKPKSCLAQGYNTIKCVKNRSPNNFCPTDKKYFKECKCDRSIYKYDNLSCKSNKSLLGKSCEGKFETCKCDTNIYKYSPTNCFNPATLAGKTCDGKYEACTCPAEYNKTCSAPMIGGELHCNKKNKTCKCSVEYKECQYGNDPSAKTCKEEDGTMKYSKCEPALAKCEDAGLSSYVPENMSCKEINTGGKICYKDCHNI